MTQNKISSLAVKYRPQNFATLTGQKHVSSVLRKAVETNQVPRQLLFSGSSGLGKTTVARICAAAILCETNLTSRDKGDACLKCDSCLSIIDADKSHPDVIEFDAASNGGKDDIKDIASKATLAPIKSDWKIYIIDEAHGLSGPGGQAFLKLLEEPPSHVIFMLATTDPQKMLKTNRSRCVEFELLRPSDLEIISNLKRVAAGENWLLTDEVALSIIEATDVSLGVRGTLMTLEKLAGVLESETELDQVLLSQILGSPDREKIKEIFDAIDVKDAVKVFSLLQKVRDNTSDASLRTALMKYCRVSLLESFEKGNESTQELTKWRYQLLVSSPDGAPWTDVILTKFLNPHFDETPESLKVQLAQAQFALASLSENLQKALKVQEDFKTLLASSADVTKELTSAQESYKKASSSLNSSKVEVEKVVKTAETFVNDFKNNVEAKTFIPTSPKVEKKPSFENQPSEKVVSKENNSSPQNNQTQQKESSAVREITPETTSETNVEKTVETLSQGIETNVKAAPRPVMQTPDGVSEVKPPVRRTNSGPPKAPVERKKVTITSPDAPKAPPRKDQVPAAGDTVAKSFDKATQLFLGSISDADIDAINVVKNSKVTFSDKAITLAVPPQYHVAANVNSKILRLAASRLQLPLKFTSL